jgi:uncharacterized sodium:solute symporter family permease YidK
MKRYYVAAVFLIIMGGVFAYIKFHQGNIEGAIWIGIIYPLLGVLAFCYGRFRPQFSFVVIAFNLILLGSMAAYAVSTGDIAWAIFLCIGSILIPVLHFFEDTPFVKEKIRSWLGP